MAIVQYLATLLLGFIAVFLLLLYRKRKRETSVFIEMSIPGPHPQAHWFWGNVLLPQDPFMLFHKWTKKYGKIYGYYDGPLGCMVISDLDFLQQVLIKQFSNFNSRQPYPIQPDPDSNQPLVHLFMAREQRWKRLRSIMNPTFSSAKLRQTAELMDEKMKIMITKMEEIANKKEESHDIQAVYQHMTLEVICDAAFGMHVDVQNNPNDKFIIKARQVFDNQAQRPLLLKFAALFPETGYILYAILVKTVMKIAAMPELWFLQRFSEAVKKRRHESIYRNDLLQLMLNATASEDNTESNDTKIDENRTNNGEVKKYKSKTLSDQELQDNCFLFFIAGYETTSSLLSYLSYLLAINPDKQEILLKEIDEYTKEADITYELVMKMPYLDMCIHETLRLYPVGAGVEAEQSCTVNGTHIPKDVITTDVWVVSRMCVKPCTVDGIHIPKGVVIRADVWTIHHDPDLWGEDPYSFVPERFSPENKANMHPLQFLGFGAGPRNCIGMRFGLMEAKLAMVQILQKFSFEKNENTEIPLLLKESGVISPVNKIQLNVLHRQK